MDGRVLSNDFKPCVEVVALSYFCLYLTAGAGFIKLNLVLRMTLSAVMLVSGIGKYLDLEGGRQAMRDFGLPAQLVPVAAALLPALELLLSATILFDGTTRLSCAALAVLFACFSVGIANLLRQDKAPPCHCFGAAHSEPVSKTTLFRALLQAATAAICGRLPLYPLTPGLKSTLLVATGFSAFAFLARRTIQRREKEANEKLNRLEVGQRIPAARTTSGDWLESLLPSDKKTLLLLTSSSCVPCHELKIQMSGWAKSVRDRLEIVEIAAKKEPKEHKEPESPFPSHSLDNEDFLRFKSSTPGAFLVDHTGTILSPPVVGAEEIEALVRMLLKSRQR